MYADICPCFQYKCQRPNFGFKNKLTHQVGLALAVIYLRQGEEKAAVEVAEKAAIREPKSAIAQNMLGVARQAAGDTAGPRAAYRKALEIDKSLLPAELTLARLDLADGNTSAARARLQSILKARSNNAQAMLELASVEEFAGNPAEALRWLEKLHAMDRRNVLATARLVDLYIRTGKPDKALVVAKETIAVAPEDLTALAAVGQSHLALADYKQAQLAFDRMTRARAPSVPATSPCCSWPPITTGPCASGGTRAICWAGENWTRRFTSPYVARRVIGSHAKNFKFLDGASTLMISEDWPQRGHQFCGHGEGEVNLESYAKMLLAIGAGDRFCAINGGEVMPLYSEAEDSILPLTAPAPHLLGACSAGIKWVNDHLTGMSLTTTTFTDGMAQ